MRTRRPPGPPRPRRPKGHLPTASRPLRHRTTLARRRPRRRTCPPGSHPGHRQLKTRTRGPMSRRPPRAPNRRSPRLPGIGSIPARCPRWTRRRAHPHHSPSRQRPQQDSATRRTGHRQVATRPLLLPALLLPALAPQGSPRQARRHRGRRRRRADPRRDPPILVRTAPRCHRLGKGRRSRPGKCPSMGMALAKTVPVP